MKHLLRVPKELVLALQEVGLQELGEQGHLCRHSTGPRYLCPDVWYFVVGRDAADVLEVLLYNLRQSTPRFLRGQPDLDSRARNVGSLVHGGGDRGADGRLYHRLKVDPEASSGLPNPSSFTGSWSIVPSAPPSGASTSASVPASVTAIPAP